MIVTNMPQAGTPEDIAAMGWVSYKEHCEIVARLEKEMKDISFKQLRTANDERQMEWDTTEDKLSVEYLGNALAGETGEACNIIKKLSRERLGLPGKKATIDDLAEELADIIIYADIIASKEGIDLGAAVRKKFNDKSIELGFKTRMT